MVFIFDFLFVDAYYKANLVGSISWEFTQDISDRSGRAEGEVVSAPGFGFCNVEMFSRPVLSHSILAGLGCKKSR